MTGDQPKPEHGGPLTGFRVLELGSTVAGPFCGRLLADFGAEVIKVEALDGDSVRSMGKHRDGKSLYAMSILRNKKLICVDLHQESGQDIIRKLVKKCDIVVENFRPGGLERWNLGYDDLRAIRPDLVMVRISGFGQTGPYSNRPGFGVIGEAMSGLREITGDPSLPPARVAVSLTDYITGLYGAFGAVMAILHRKRTGHGQLVDTALYEAAFSFMEPFVPAFDQLGHIPARAGSKLPGHAPNNLYPTRDGRYIHIAAANQGLFRKLSVVMGRADLLVDARFATAISRGQNATGLDEIVGEWTSAHDLAELERILISEGNIPAARIYNLPDIFDDPHYRARDMLPRVSDPELGQVAFAGVVPKLSDSPGSIQWAGGEIGANTREILCDLLAFTPSEIERLERAKVVRCSI